MESNGRHVTDHSPPWRPGLLLAIVALLAACSAPGQAASLAANTAVPDSQATLTPPSTLAPWPVTTLTPVAPGAVAGTALTDALLAQDVAGAPADAAGPAGIIAAVTITGDARGPDKTPAAPVAAFGPRSIVHAVVSLADAPPGTALSAAWYVGDVGDSSVNGRLIDEATLTTEGTRNVDFTLRPKTHWAAGQYRVVISVNGARQRVVDYAVR